MVTPPYRQGFGRWIDEHRTFNRDIDKLISQFRTSNHSFPCPQQFPAQLLRRTEGSASVLRSHDRSSFLFHTQELQRGCERATAPWRSHKIESGPALVCTRLGSWIDEAGRGPVLGSAVESQSSMTSLPPDSPVTLLLPVPRQTNLEIQRVPRWKKITPTFTGIPK
ncbi:UNVERIFIED_CONTAM: hypothetical protein FKN15_017004 [Acipenser sinensis]